jgi:hypothetical protein
MSEFILAWRSDLRDLIGHDLPRDIADSSFIHPASMFDSAVLGVNEIDRILRSVVDQPPDVKREAETRV